MEAIRNFGVCKMLRIICIMLLVVRNGSASLDLSNLNINDFQFFRYQQRLPNGELKTVKPPPPSLQSHIQKTEAVGTFVRRLLLGYSGADNMVISIPFAPTVPHLRKRFEMKYGYRGEHLIEQLGNGSFRYSSGYTPCYSCRH